MAVIRNKIPKAVRETNISSSTKRKEDALQLAQVLYDIYKESHANANMAIGQNNANHIKHD
jgi:hypothetical protein